MNNGKKPFGSYGGQYEAEMAQKQRQEMEAMMQGPQQGADLGGQGFQPSVAALGNVGALLNDARPPLSDQVAQLQQQVFALDAQLRMSFDRIAELERFTGAGGR